MEQIDAGDDVEAGIGQRQRLGVGFGERHPRPGCEPPPGDGKIRRRQIDSGHRQPRVVALDLGEERAGAAGDVEQPSRTAAPFAIQQRLPKRHQRLAPHRRGAAAEQHLDLMVVALGRGRAQIAVALEVEMLAVIGRIAGRLRQLQPALAGIAVAAGVDRAQIGEKIDRAQ